MVTATLRKKTPAADTSAQPVDENAAERLADSLGLPASDSAVQGAPLVAEVVGQSETAVVTVTRASIAHPVQNDPAMRGEIDQNDFRLPRLTIVNGSGPLSQKFNAGSLLYADEKLLGTPDLAPNAVNPHLVIVPVCYDKQWRENITEEQAKEQETPRIFSTLTKAMEALGPNCNRWMDGQKPRVSASGRCIVLLREPEGCQHSGFLRQLDGHNYAPAVYYCSGTAYSQYVVAINSKIELLQRDPNPINERMSRHFWTLRIRRGTGQYGMWLPNVTMSKDATGPELRAYAAELRGQQVKDDGQ
jgi:hypothetical protein